MQFPPTPEQQLILDFIRTSSENVLINARAGAAKTTTIEMIAHQETKKSILCVAFNKKIAVELTSRLPSNAKASTLHSLGNAAFKGLLGKWPKLDDKKCYFLLKAEIDKLSEEEKEEAYEDMSDTLRFIGECKNAGMLPKGLHPSAKPLYTEDNNFEFLDEMPNALQRPLIYKVIRKSFELALQGTIDFNDMVYLPAILPVSFPRQDIVMVDETQDLSLLNHILVAKLAKNSRLVAVGDPCQAIYGFRGADENSMSALQAQFKMREFFLTVCFRSASSIVQNARWRAPDMQWREGAPEGIVRHRTSWSIHDLQDGDAIICRNNAPLFRLGLCLLRNNLFPEMMSGDITKGLLAIMKKLGKPSLPRDSAKTALAEWKEANERKYKSRGRLEDTTTCLYLMIDETDNLGEAMDKLKHLMNVAGRIKLMTGHKSKGLEFDRVWFLDPFLCADEGQDRNVRYVIETRAREELNYVNTKELEEFN